MKVIRMHRPSGWFFDFGRDFSKGLIFGYFLRINSPWFHYMVVA